MYDSVFGFVRQCGNSERTKIDNCTEVIVIWKKIFENNFSIFKIKGEESIDSRSNQNSTDTLSTFVLSFRTDRLEWIEWSTRGCIWWTISVPCLARTCARESVRAGFVHAHVYAGSLKRVNGCNTWRSSVRVTVYYELNNVMIATAPVPRRICVYDPCIGCRKG